MRTLEGLDPAGFQRVGSPEVYDKDNLFAYMNGEAEVYFPFGFELLVVNTYRKQDNTVQMAMEAYDMGTALGARGVFQEYTRRKGTTLQALGEAAWTDNNIALFFRNRYFVRILPDPFQEVIKEPTSHDLLALSLAVDTILKTRIPAK